MQKVRLGVASALIGLAAALVTIVSPYSWPDSMSASAQYAFWITAATCILAAVILVGYDLWRHFISTSSNGKVRTPPALSDISTQQPVLYAISEFDQLGRDRFLRKYGFRRAKSYWLVHNGKRYDSKAVLGAARGYARPDLGPLKPTEFGGGEATVKPKLEELGFTVVVK